MNVKELMKEATPLPWISGLQEPRLGARKVNEKLFVHCVNNFMPLLEALEGLLSDWERVHGAIPEDHEARAAIAAAKEVK